MIRRIRSLAGPAGQATPLRLGIGDDCAILDVPRGHQLLITTDLCIEDVHFRRAWHPARSVGHRCLARGLSDIAAMGGVPIACFLSLGLPPALPQSWVDGFLTGLVKLGRKFGVQLAGGDTSAAPKITADIMVTGQVESRRAILRSGAQPGDYIYVTGRLGASAAMLKRMMRRQKPRPTATSPHFYPVPRVEIGRWLLKNRAANSMIDLSDGLSIDLAHICEESRVSACISEATIPVAVGANLQSALHGGEDYELLFTAAPSTRIPARICGVPIRRIGEMTGLSRMGTVMIQDARGRTSKLPPLGWQHFRKSY